ncbi:hypothetical protein [Nostoc sp. TCL26-01]|uniref:hypothetical protein n=1 Tax=Nostoc sp. TCL26-01 TaxID=2576904 RepID=UPI0015B86DF6|nr:hypothetical protein [Nostoc sp. TCL26-01]QLE55856.1 hypothetical protein FD725_10170 [Nostoc sp. TCL26-01]
MAAIAIADLRPAGSELLYDCESFMDELSEGELSIQGGITPSAFWASVAVVGGAAVISGAVSAAVAYFSK